MPVKRLRDRPDLSVTCQEPHDHMAYGMGHGLRVDLTELIAATMVSDGFHIADLSCGNAAVPRRLADRFVGVTLTLGDYAPGYEITGMIEDTIHAIDHVDLFVCGETIEHLDDPLLVLAQIRQKADSLVLSTPIGCWEDTEIQHLWAWDREGVEGLLDEVGFTVARYASVDASVFGEVYEYGVFGCM